MPLLFAPVLELAQLEKMQTITLAGGEGGGAASGGGGGGAAKRLVNEDAHLELFHSKISYGAWRQANLTLVNDSLLATPEGEIVMGADESPYMREMARAAARPHTR